LAVLITQTGGGCRATNYIALIRKALERSEEHEADKRNRMRKMPLSPNERDW